MNATNEAKSNAQKEALAQLRAAFEACKAAGLTVVVSVGDTAHEVGVSDLDSVEGEPVAVLWCDDSQGLYLDQLDAEVEDVEEICESWIAGLGGDLDNAWPNVLSELADTYCAGTPAYDCAVILARNYFRAY